MRWNQLKRGEVGLLVVDVQEALVAKMDRACEVVQTIGCAIRGGLLLGLPLCITEQYPQGLGPTVIAVREAWGDSSPLIFSKTTFSCLGDLACKTHLLDGAIKQWLIVGVEAHICVLQTAKDLVRAGKGAVVLNDAITSRSVFDFSTGIAELRDLGIRVTSLETALFELLENSTAPEFRQISRLVR